VPLRIEIAEPDDVTGTARELLRTRQDTGRFDHRLVVQGKRLHYFNML
jgi:sortase (surface protein transpeptidase)